MQNISRESVIKAITDLTLSYIASIDHYQTKANEQSKYYRGARLRWHQEIYATEEGIITLMWVANELGLYEEVEKRVPIPQYLRDEFRKTEQAE
jgi:hypothetical protein